MAETNNKKQISWLALGASIVIIMLLGFTIQGVQQNHLKYSEDNPSEPAIIDKGLKIDSRDYLFSTEKKLPENISKPKEKPLHIDQ